MPGEEHGRHADGRPDGHDAAIASVIAFDVFRIDCRGRRLTRDGVRLRIQQKPLDVLIYLVRNRAQVVPREELLERFWPRAINDESLTRCISTIRTLLGDTRAPPRYIETLWGRGYRFIAAVEQPAATEDPGGDFVQFNTVANRGSQPEGIAATISRWRGPLALATATTLTLVLALIFLWDRIASPREIAVRGLAVVPMQAEPGAEGWLAAALTDRLVETVSRIEGVRVVAHGSTARFSIRSDPAEIGRQLGVDAVLLTRLAPEGDRTVLRARLVSARDGSVLWTYSATRAMHETGDDDQVRHLARSVARRLWADLQLGESDRLVDPGAYRHYLRGRYYWNQRSRDALTAAIESYNSALELEPDYEDALLGLADSWLVMPLYDSRVSPSDAIPKARAAAERALELDRGAAHAHAVLGVIAMQYDWDWSEAEAQLRRALTLNPNDATAEQWLGELYCYRLRERECRRHLRAASGLDPLSPVLRMMRGSPALFSGDFRTAVVAYSEALEDDPVFPLSRYVLGLAYAGLQDWDRAIESYEASLPDLGLEVVGGPMAYALARRGETAQARALLAELERLADKQYVPPTKIAAGWLGLEERDRVFEWLERALDVHDDRLVYLAVDVHFLELHEDPDFRTYADRLGLLDVLQARTLLAQRSQPTSANAGEEAEDGGDRQAR